MMNLALMPPPLSSFVMRWSLPCLLLLPLMCLLVKMESLADGRSNPHVWVSQIMCKTKFFIISHPKYFCMETPLCI